MIKLIVHWSCALFILTNTLVRWREVSFVHGRMVTDARLICTRNATPTRHLRAEEREREGKPFPTRFDASPRSPYYICLFFQRQEHSFPLFLAWPGPPSKFRLSQSVASYSRRWLYFSFLQIFPILLGGMNLSTVPYARTSGNDDLKKLSADWFCFVFIYHSKIKSLCFQS